MKKRDACILGFSLTGALLLSVLVGLNPFEPKHYKADEYVPEENAYFVETIDDPAGLIRAHKFVTPTDNRYNTQKSRSLGTDLIGNIESVWSSYTGKGTTVAIIDDGFDYDHPEYIRSDNTSAILSTSRYYYESGYSSLYKEYSEDPSCVAEGWESSRGKWATHGTNTSTTAAAPMNNGGGVGIAPDADILALKVDMSFAAIKGAIQYAVSQGVDVINLSLGAYSEDFIDGFGDQQEGSSSVVTYLDSVCQSAYNAGVIVVAAAGNEATYHKSYPACNKKVIGVGATGDYDNKGNANKLAEFTNYVGASQTGEVNVDILAPGYVYTATQGGTKQSSHTHIYDDTQGTSFSSPIVAGAACLWKEKYPNGTPAQFLEQLQASADGIGTYASKNVPVSGWDSACTDVGPSNIENGRLNVASLLAIDDPYVSTLQSNLSISVGEKKQINLRTYNGSISYSSSNANVATVNSSGLVEGKGAGSAVITVTATKNEQTATAQVNVNVSEVIALTSLAFNPNEVTLTVGETYESEPTIDVTPSDGTRAFLFESDNESVATVDIDTGLVSAVAPGTANILAMSGYGDADDTLTVTVEQATTPTSWNKVTSDSQLTDGDYLIVYEDGNKAFDGSRSTLDATNNTIGVTISSGSIAYSQATAASKFTINALSDGYSIRSASGQYIGREANSNGLDTSTTDAYKNYISISNGNATILSEGGKTLCFNTANDQQRFRYMSSGGDIQLYKVSGGGSTSTVTSVTVTPSQLALDVYNNSTGNLAAMVSGTNSPAQTVTWTSSDTSVATVSNAGVVTAKKAGSATITATSTVDSSKSGSCSVTVTDSTPKTLSSISASGYKTDFNVGDTFSFGGTVTATFSDSSNANVTNSCTFAGYNMSTAGNQTVTVSYTYAAITKTTSYQITVTSIAPVTDATYTIGWGTASGEAGTYTNFDATSGSVTNILSFTTAKNSATNAPVYNENNDELRLYYSSDGKGGSITITPAEGITFTGFTMTTSTSPSVKYSIDGGTATSVSASNYTYSASGFEATSSIKIQNVNTSNTQLRIKKIALTYSVLDESDKIVQSLSATYSGSSVYIGDDLDTSKVSVTANYTDSVKYPAEQLSSSDYQLSGFSSVSAGNKTVTVTYCGSYETSSSPLTTTFSVEVIADTVTSVSVSVSKSYHPGDVIHKSDITVTLSWQSGKPNTTTTDFAFAYDGYQFTYEDAPSGGASANKQFSIVYADAQYNFNASVSRVAPETITDTTTTLGSSQFNGSDVSKSSGTESSDSVTIGGINFTVTTNAYIYQGCLSFNTTAGHIQNASAFAQDLTSITVMQKSGARQDGILTISKDGSTWAAYSAAEIAKGGYRYFKYAYEGEGSGSGGAKYSNIQSISFTLAGADNPTNVANYIMYEDTQNQCLTKLDLAINKLNTMSSENKTLFWTSDDYVIAISRERLIAWAAHEGKTLDLSNGEYVVSGASYGLANVDHLEDKTDSMMAVALISLIGLSAAGGFIFVKRRKEN